MGTLNWTGDDPVMFPVDCPDLGGFVSSVTVTKADMWKLGQVKAGDTIRYKPVSWESAVETRRDTEGFVSAICHSCATDGGFNGIKPLGSFRPVGLKSEEIGGGVVHRTEEDESQPLVSYRQVFPSILVSILLCAALSLTRHNRVVTNISLSTMAMDHLILTIVLGLRL